MTRHRRYSKAVLLLYYIQVVLVGRALALETQSTTEVYILSKANRTGVNDHCLFNTTIAFNNATFANDTTLLEDTCFFNDAFFNGTTKLNKTVLKPSTDMVYKIRWEDCLFVGLLGISSLVGTIGNAAVILAFCLYKKIRTTANAFILNTSILDLVTSAVIIPLSISSMVTGLPNCEEACCAFVGFVNVFSLGQSLLSCVLIAFNRYVYVVLSVATYKRLFGPVKSFLWILGAWLFKTLGMIPAILGKYGSFGWDAYFQICQLSSDDPVSPLFFKVVLMSFYCIEVLAIVGFYIRIYLHVRSGVMAIGQHLNHSPQQVSLQAVKRTKHMFYIFITFFILTCPAMVVSSVDFRSKFLPKALYVTTASFFYWNSAVNPIIYTWTLKEFRQGFKSMVRCKRHNVFTAAAPQPTVKRTNVVSLMTVSNRVDHTGAPMPLVET